MKETFAFQKQTRSANSTTQVPLLLYCNFFYIARKRCYHLYRLTDARVKRAQRRGVPRWHPCVWHHHRAAVALRLLKTQPLHLFSARCVSGLLSLWRCRLVRLFHPMKWLEIKPKSDISMSVNYQQSHLSSPIRLASHRGLRNFHEAWTILTDAWKKGKCDKIWTSSH